MTNITTDTWWVTHKITCRGQEQYVMVADGEVWAWDGRAGKRRPTDMSYKDVVLWINRRKAPDDVTIEEVPCIVWDTCEIHQHLLADLMDHFQEEEFEHVWENDARFMSLFQTVERSREKFRESVMADESLKDDMESLCEKQVHDDQDRWQWEAEDHFERVTSLMRDLHESTDWYAEVRNFGWRNQSGHKTFRAETGPEFLQAILPQTDCTYKVYFRGDHIAINNAHHDSPTWNEWYTIYPAFACEGWCERVYKRDDVIETDDGLFCSACKKRIDDAPESR